MTDPIRRDTVRTILIAAAIVIFPLSQINAQTLSPERAEDFIDLLLVDSPQLREFVHPEQLSQSEAFGIEYDNITNKFLIASGLSPAQIDSASRFECEYDYQIESLDAPYSILNVSIPVIDYAHDFYFENGLLISPIRYHTRKWNQLESEHFIFTVSDATNISYYSIASMGSFLRSAMNELGFDKELRENIRDVKIRYFLCRNADEVALLTGYKARGTCDLANDYVISSFNSHYHELTHLLVSIRLKHPPLYVHPFLQEGIAVALGGRGGKEPGTILNLGKVIVESGLLDYRDLLSTQGFVSVDASFAYPLAGLYSRFLVNEIGIDRFLELYMKYSGDSDDVLRMSINRADIPDNDRWLSYIESFEPNTNIVLDCFRDDCDHIYESDFARIYADSIHYHFAIEDTLLIGKLDSLNGYISSKFTELLPDREYHGEHYLLIAEPAEIRIYDLGTNNLIANYVSAFTTDMKAVTKREDRLLFSVNREIFHNTFAGSSMP